MSPASLALAEPHQTSGVAVPPRPRPRAGPTRGLSAGLSVAMLVGTLLGCVSDPGVKPNPRPSAPRAQTTNAVLREVGDSFPRIADRGPWNSDGLRSDELRVLERRLENQVATNPTALLLSKLAELKLFMYPGDSVRLEEALNLFERSVNDKSGGSPDWIPGWLGLVRVALERSKGVSLPQHVHDAERSLGNAVSAFNALESFRTGPGRDPTEPLRPGISPEQAAETLDADMLESELLVFDSTAGSSLLRGYGLGDATRGGLRGKRVAARIQLAAAEIALERFRLARYTRPSDGRNLALKEVDELFQPIFERDPDFMEASMRKHRTLLDAGLSSDLDGDARRDLLVASKLAARSVLLAAFTVRKARAAERPDEERLLPQPDLALARALLESSFLEREILLESLVQAADRQEWERRHGGDWNKGYELALEVLSLGENPRYPDDGTVAAWAAGIQSQETRMLVGRGRLDDATGARDDAEHALSFAEGAKGSWQAQPDAIKQARDAFDKAKAALGSEPTGKAVR